MPYDRQVVVQLDFDSTISDNAAALNKYGNDKGIPSELVQVHAGIGNVGFKPMDVAKLTQALKKLSLRSRVYLQAHGAWKTQKLSDYDGDQVAGLLVGCGIPAVQVVSVLGCESGRDLGTANDARVAASMDSFGSRFHRALRDKGGLKLSVFARIYCVGIGNPVEETGKNVKWHGHKGTFDEDDDWDSWKTASHRSKSKLRFYWDGETQRREWAY
ncbi:MAG: C80 family cysteine peptidase [Alphaproteobacteria bacterium]